MKNPLDVLDDDIRKDIDTLYALSNHKYTRLDIDFVDIRKSIKSFLDNPDDGFKAKLNRSYGHIEDINENKMNPACMIESLRMMHTNSKKIYIIPGLNLLPWNSPTNNYLEKISEMNRVPDYKDTYKVSRFSVEHELGHAIYTAFQYENKYNNSYNLRLVEDEAYADCFAVMKAEKRGLGDWTENYIRKIRNEPAFIDSYESRSPDEIDKIGIKAAYKGSLHLLKEARIIARTTNDFNKMQEDLGLLIIRQDWEKIYNENLKNIKTITVPDYIKEIMTQPKEQRDFNKKTLECATWMDNHQGDDKNLRCIDFILSANSLLECNNASKDEVHSLAYQAISSAINSINTDQKIKIVFFESIQHTKQNFDNLKKTWNMLPRVFENSPYKDYLTKCVENGQKILNQNFKEKDWVR